MLSVRRSFCLLLLLGAMMVLSGCSPAAWFAFAALSGPTSDGEAAATTTPPISQPPPQEQPSEDPTEGHLYSVTGPLQEIFVPPDPEACAVLRFPQGETKEFLIEHDTGVGVKERIEDALISLPASVQLILFNPPGEGCHQLIRVSVVTVIWRAK